MAPTHTAQQAVPPLSPAKEPQYHERFPRASIEWEADEYPHSDKSNDWYWALGLVAVSAAVAALLFNNVLFAVLILLSSFVLALFASRKPERVRFAVMQRGIRAHGKLYPYQTLKSFYIEELPGRTPMLLLESAKVMTPLIVLPLEGVDADHVHDFLLDVLPEEEHSEPLPHRLMEWLGF